MINFILQNCKKVLIGVDPMLQHCEYMRMWVWCQVTIQKLVTPKIIYIVLEMFVFRSCMVLVISNKTYVQMGYVLIMNIM